MFYQAMCLLSCGLQLHKFCMVFSTFLKHFSDQIGGWQSGIKWCGITDIDMINVNQFFLTLYFQCCFWRVGKVMLIQLKGFLISNTRWLIFQLTQPTFLPRSCVKNEMIPCVGAVQEKKQNMIDSTKLTVAFVSYFGLQNYIVF